LGTKKDIERAFCLSSLYRQKAKARRDNSSGPF
jgi:hypothetical protein